MGTPTTETSEQALDRVAWATNRRSGAMLAEIETANVVKQHRISVNVARTG